MVVKSCRLRAHKFNLHRETRRKLRVSTFCGSFAYCGCSAQLTDRCKFDQLTAQVDSSSSSSGLHGGRVRIEGVNLTNSLRKLTQAVALQVYMGDVPVLSPGRGTYRLV
jgi:hypothetical protein